MAGPASPARAQASTALTLQGSVLNPIDPRQQTALAFGQRSHWLQPWRAYSLTPPATQLQRALGVTRATHPKPWLAYVAAVATEAGSALGGQDFDLEVWNELTFGSDFLDVNNYYSPAVDGGSGSAPDAILGRTVAWLRDPAHTTWPRSESGTASPTPSPGTRARPAHPA